MDKATELYNFIKANLVDSEHVSQKELDSTGYEIESLEDLLFYHTSWRDLDQAQEMLEVGHFYSNM